MPDKAPAKAAPARKAPEEDAPSGPRFQGVVNHRGRVTVSTHASAQEAHDWAEAFAQDVTGTYEVNEV